MERKTLRTLMYRVRPSALVLVFVGASLLGSLSTMAQDRYYDYANIDITYTVNADSTVGVSEKQTFDFHGEYHQGQRIIPHKGSDAISDIVVLDGTTGAPLTFSSQASLDKNSPQNWGKYIVRSDGDQVIVEWYYDAASIHGWIIRYTLRGAVSFYDDHDELYWNLFDSYDAPVKQVSGTVVLPAADTAPRAHLYANGNHDVVSGWRNAHTFHFSASHFEPREAVTLAVAWQKGMVTDRYWRSFIVRNWAYSLATLAFVLTLSFAVSYRRVAVRRARPSLNIHPECELRIGVPPAVADLIMNNDTSDRTWSATIVDLAIRGYLTIEEVSSPSAVAFMKTTTHYDLHRVSPVDYSKLLSFELHILRALFPGGRDILSLCESGLSRKQVFELTTALGEAKKKLVDEAIQSGFFAREPVPGYKNWLPIMIAIVAPVFVFVVVAVVTFILMAIVAAIIPPVTGFMQNLAGSLTHYSIVVFPYLVLLYALGICYLITKAVVRYKSPLNDQGLLLRERLRCFKQYLVRAGKDNSGQLEQDAFNTNLSYAIVFRVEKKWGKEFERAKLPPPNWYTSTYIGGATPNMAMQVYFANTFSRNFNASTTPSIGSAGTGGFAGGGGSAGGGGGGGGGGAS